MIEILAGVRPGEVLAGKYRVERVLGRGGMGCVVAAHHLELDEKVALKFLLAGALENPDAVNRFVREARAAVKIKSEHVARVSDVGRLENGLPYMVMEYLEGGDLSAWIEQRGPMPLEQAVDFVLQVCEAIAEAHAHGIIHRDLKPSNLFCVQRADGLLSAKVLDFGISKMAMPDMQAQDMTRTAAVIGSPRYMSPEQLQSPKSVDARTDVWSLGVIVFELLTGQVPFDGESLTELAIRIATAPAPPVRHLRADLPPGVEQAIATCLEKDRARRFPSIAELAIAFKDFGSKRAKVSVERILGTLRAAGLSAAALPPSGEFRSASQGSGQTLAAPQTQANWGHTGAEARLRTWPVLWIGAMLGLLLVAAAAVVAIGRWPGRAAASRAPRPPNPASSLAVPNPAASSPIAPSLLDPGPLDAGPLDAGPAAADAGAGAPEDEPPDRPTVRPPKPPPPPPRPACTPNYFFDSNGEKHFKPECFR